MSLRVWKWGTVLLSSHCRDKTLNFPLHTCSSPGFLGPRNNRNINQIFQVKTLALILDILLQSLQHSVHQKNLPILSQKHIPTLSCSLQLYHHNYNPSHFNFLLTSFPLRSPSMVHLPTVIIYLLNGCDITFRGSLKFIKSFIPCLTLQIPAWPGPD